jgi:hypothetical protein
MHNNYPCSSYISPATTTASSSPSGGFPLRLSLPLRPCQAHSIYVACPCPTPSSCGGGRQCPSTAPNPVSPTQAGAVLRLRGHGKCLRGIVGSFIRGLARKSCRSLTMRTTSHPARDSLSLMAHSRRMNVKIRLAYCLHLHLSQVLERCFVVHAMASQLPSHESVALSDPALIHRIPARVQVQAALGVQDTI